MPTDRVCEYVQKFFCYMCKQFKRHSHSKGLCQRRGKYVKDRKEACAFSGLIKPKIKII